MKKNWNFSMAQFLWYDCTFKKQCTVPVTLTFELWRSIYFQWIEYSPISILYKFQIDISSNSWEIKYQNIGRTHTQTHTHTHTQTHTHTDRQTGWKQYLATHSGGEVKMLPKRFWDWSFLPYIVDADCRRRRTSRHLKISAVSWHSGAKNKTIKKKER